MSRFMGYDPESVQHLRSAMQRAEAELGLIRCDDAEAAMAMQYVRRVQHTLGDTWIPVLDSLFTCQALTSYQPMRLDPTELTTSRLGVLQHRYGWMVVTDPLAPTDTSVTLDQAQSLGWTLSHGEVRALISDSELTWLNATLSAIARQPKLSRAFAANMSHNGWTQLCNALADDRIVLTSARTIEGALGRRAELRLDDIDGIFGSLGTILVDQRARHQPIGVSPPFEEMNPYAAAMIVQHLQLSADELAAVSEALIIRYRTGGWADVQRAGPGTADLLMQLIIDTPGAAAVFVSRVARNPSLLFDSAHSSALAEQLLLLGTAPGNMTVGRAGAVIPGLLRYIQDSYTTQVGFFGQPDPAIRTFGVDLVAPWLLQFTQTRGSAWGLTGAQRAQLLESVINDAGAFAELCAQRAVIADGLTHVIAGSADTQRHAVTDLAAMLGLIDTLTRHRAITRATDARRLWDIGFALIGASVSMLPGGALTTVSSGVALTGLRSVLVEQGIAPKSETVIAHDTLYALDWQTTVAAATVVCATFDQMVSDARIASSTPAPPLPDPRSKQPGASYSAAFSVWLDANALGEAGVVLDAIKQTFMSVHEAERNATDLSL